MIKIAVNATLPILIVSLCLPPAFGGDRERPGRQLYRNANLFTLTAPNRRPLPFALRRKPANHVREKMWSAIRNGYKTPEVEAMDKWAKGINHNDANTRERAAHGEGEFAAAYKDSERPRGDGHNVILLITAATIFQSLKENWSSEELRRQALLGPKSGTKKPLAWIADLPAWENYSMDVPLSTKGELFLGLSEDDTWGTFPNAAGGIATIRVISGGDLVTVERLVNAAGAEVDRDRLVLENPLPSKIVVGKRHLPSAHGCPRIQYQDINGNGRCIQVHEPNMWNTAWTALGQTINFGLMNAAGVSALGGHQVDRLLSTAWFKPLFMSFQKGVETQFGRGCASVFVMSMVHMFITFPILWESMERLTEMAAGLMEQDDRIRSENLIFRIAGDLKSAAIANTTNFANLDSDQQHAAMRVQRQSQAELEDDARILFSLYGNMWFILAGNGYFLRFIQTWLREDIVTSSFALMVAGIAAAGIFQKEIPRWAAQGAAATGRSVARSSAFKALQEMATEGRLTQFAQNARLQATVIRRFGIQSAAIARRYAVTRLGLRMLLLGGRGGFGITRFLGKLGWAGLIFTGVMVAIETAEPEIRNAGSVILKQTAVDWFQFRLNLQDDIVRNQFKKPDAVDRQMLLTLLANRQRWRQAYMNEINFLRNTLIDEVQMRESRIEMFVEGIEQVVVSKQFGNEPRKRDYGQLVEANLSDPAILSLTNDIYEDDTWARSGKQGLIKRDKDLLALYDHELDFLSEVLNFSPQARTIIKREANMPIPDLAAVSREISQSIDEFRDVELDLKRYFFSILLVRNYVYFQLRVAPERAWEREIAEFSTPKPGETLASGFQRWKKECLKYFEFRDSPQVARNLAAIDEAEFRWRNTSNAEEKASLEEVIHVNEGVLGSYRQEQSLEESDRKMTANFGWHEWEVVEEIVSTMRENNQGQLTVGVEESLKTILEKNLSILSVFPSSGNTDSDLRKWATLLTVPGASQPTPPRIRS